MSLFCCLQSAPPYCPVVIVVTTFCKTTPSGLKNPEQSTYPEQQVVRVSRRGSKTQEHLTFEPHYPAAAAEQIPEKLAVTLTPSR